MQRRMREEAPSCRAQTRKRRERTSTGQRNPAGRRSSFFWSWESPPPVAGAGRAGSLAGTAQATRRRSSAEAGVIETPDCGGAARYESASATHRAVCACSSSVATSWIFGMLWNTPGILPAWKVLPRPTAGCTTSPRRPTRCTKSSRDGSVCGRRHRQNAGEELLKRRITGR